MKSVATRRRLINLNSFLSAGKDAENLFLDNHKYDVQNPDDVPAKQQTQNTGYNLALLNSGDNAANQRRDWDDCENKTYYPTKSKVIVLFCHNNKPPFTRQTRIYISITIIANIYM